MVAADGKALTDHNTQAENQPTHGTQTLRAGPTIYRILSSGQGYIAAT